MMRWPRVGSPAPLRLLLGAISLCLAASGVAAQETDWTGRWDTRWSDGGATLYLQQDGVHVVGTYPVLEGEITAEVRGRLLTGVWRDAGGSGEFKFAMSPDGQSFMGRYATGAWWTGARIAAAGGGEIVADASTPETALRTLITAGNGARDKRIDRFEPALDILDFDDLPPETADTPEERLRLAAALFDVLDRLTFRIPGMPRPEPGDVGLTVTLSEAGSGETFDLYFRYSVRADGGSGWFIVVPDPVEIEAALARMRGGAGLLDPNAHEALDSPRSAIRTFLEQYAAWESTGQSALLFSTMNLEHISQTVRADEGAIRARYLKQILDRIGSVVWQEVPNDPERVAPYTHFVHPAGRVTIAPYETEDGSRTWRVARETLDAVRPLYLALEDMPPESLGATETTSGFMALRSAVRSFDRDLLQAVYGVEIWQAIVLVAALLASAMLALVIGWLMRVAVPERKRSPERIARQRTGFIRPLQALIVAGAGFGALRMLGFPEIVDVPLRVAFGVIMALAGGWLAISVVDRLGAPSAGASTRFTYRDEMLRSVVVAVAKVVVIIGAVIALAEILAIPYEGVIAGLGIGGLAVALAARSTLENFIGGLTMLADKPVRVGDFCRFDNDKLGTIETLGLRSVKIRSLDRTLFVVPNGQFINMNLENFARRDSIRLLTTLQLRYETTPDQLRFVLAEIRRLLLKHPEILEDPLRARFVGFGAHSLDVEVLAYVATSDFNKFLAVQEDVLLRITDIVEAAGSGFAFPSSVNYIARDRGLDAERTAKIEATVREWRADDKLPFPEFDRSEHDALLNSMDWPERGSPHSPEALQRAAGRDPSSRG